jgi:hypothetical protein
VGSKQQGADTAVRQHELRDLADVERIAERVFAALIASGERGDKRLIAHRACDLTDALLDAMDYRFRT